MKFKFLFAFLLGGFAAASAQGFTDGVHYFRADQPEEAEIIINRVLNDPSTDKALANYYLGKIAVQRKNYDNAKKYFDAGVAANASNPYNYVGLGELALKNGDAKSAENYFKDARKYDKKNADLLADIARAYYDADPTLYAKEIEKTIKDAKKADKDNPAIFILEADMLAPTNVGEAAGYYEMAMNSADGADYPDAFVKYARTYFHVNPKFAIEGLRKLLEIQPNSALAQRELAEKYYDNNQLTRAAEQYGEYIKNPNHFKRDEQRYVGLLFFGERFDESNALAQKILSEDPENFYMKRMTFYNEAALKNNEIARQKAESFFNATNGEFNPKDYTTYSDVLVALGEDSLAVIAFEKAVASAPDKLDLLKDLSSMYTQAEMYDKAAEAQQKFIDAGDYSTNDLMVLARRYQNAAASSEIGTPERAKFSEKAVETINKVYELVPDNYQVQSTRARIMLIANDNEPNADVVAALELALATLDADAENVTKRPNDYIFIYNQLGKYYYDQKDMDKAKMYYTKFLEIDPDNEPLRQFVETLLSDKK